MSKVAKPNVGAKQQGGANELEEQDDAEQ